MVYLMIALNYTLLCPTFSRCLCHFISGLSLVLMPFSSFVNTKFTSPGASRTEFLKTRKPYHSPLPLKTHIKVPQPSEQRTISFRGFLRTPSYFSPSFLFPLHHSTCQSLNTVLHLCLFTSCFLYLEYLLILMVNAFSRV